MAKNTVQKLKFSSLDEAKEFLLNCKEKNEEVSQKDFMEAVTALNLDDDAIDELYSWIDDNFIEFNDEHDIDEEDMEDDLDSDSLEEEDSIAEEISQLEQTFANASHAKINDPVKMYLKVIYKMGNVLKKIWNMPIHMIYGQM